MCLWVGKQVKQNDEEITNEQAHYYQLLLNFWKELESEREIKLQEQRAKDAAGLNF